MATVSNTLQQSFRAVANELAVGTVDQYLARVEFGPARAGEVWSISRISISSTSQVYVPTFFLYRAVESPSALIDGSSTGQFDINILDTPLVLAPGERVVAVWGTSVQPVQANASNPGSGGCDQDSACVITVEGRSNR